LARYCEGKRVVVRNSHASDFEAVRALAANHVGAEAKAAGDVYPTLASALQAVTSERDSDTDE
jgi:hypothetical protein